MKTIVITGASSGIGYETAKALALEGHLIIAASRRRNDTLQKIEDLNRICERAHSQGRVLFSDLDLSDTQNVQEFISKVTGTYPVIDTLICNAGVMNTPYKHTTDGYEIQFQVNFLSHFKICHGLIENLLQSENPKIINVCSASAEKGQISSIEGLAKISNVSEDAYDGMTSYRESKLAQQVTSMEFSRQEQYRKIKFSVVHPGIVNTNLFYQNSGKLYTLLMLPFVYLGYIFRFFKTPAQGAKTSIILSETDDYESGLYWTVGKILEPNPIATNQHYAKELWDWSLEHINT